MNIANLFYNVLFNNSKKIELVLKKGLKSNGKSRLLHYSGDKCAESPESSSAV